MRREMILNAARRVIESCGFEDSTVDKIAAEAEFTKRTIYQYFRSKEEILYALGADLLGDIPAALGESAEGPGTARSRLEDFAWAFFGRIRDRPMDAAVMDKALSFRNEYRARSGEAEPGSELAVLESRLGNLYAYFASLVVEGLADGSLRKDLAVEGAAFAVFFLFRSLLGFFAHGEARRVSAEGKSGEDLARYALDLLLLGMRNE